MTDNDSQKESLKQVHSRLDYLEELVREQVARLYQIEQRLGLEKENIRLEPLPPVAPVIEALPSAPVVAEPPPPVVTPTEPIALTPEVRDDVSAAEDRLAEPVIASPVIELPEERETSLPPIPPVVQPASAACFSEEQVSAAPASSGLELESLIGGRWFNLIGTAAVILGVGFFLKLAFDQGWIGPTGRVMIGVVIGVGMLVGGDRLTSRGYRTYSQGLFGGGIAILYLSIFAAFARYELISQVTAFGLMSLVTATAVLLAARYDALAIAILGLIGGFLTPVMLSTGRDNQTGLFTYIVLLDLGVLAVAYWKQWRSLNYLAFWSTVLMSAGWYLEHYEDPKLWKTMLFFTLLFVIFATLAIFHNVINRKPTTRLDLSLLFSNATLYFSSSYGLLNDNYRPWLGLFAVLVSAFYLGYGYLAYSRNRADRYLIYSFLGLATLFLTLAIPIQFDQQWVTMGWAIEGAVLTWIGLKGESRATRWSGVLMFAIAVWHWFVVDVHDFAYYAWQSFTPILNQRAASVIVTIAAFTIAAWFYRRLGEPLADDERTWFAEVFLLAANVLAVVWLSLDVQDYFTQAEAALRDVEDLTVNFEAIRQIQNTGQLVLTALWGIYGAAALFTGIGRRIRLVRYFSLALLALTAIKVIFVDSEWYDASWHRLILNRTFAAFLLTITALVAGTYFYKRATGIAESERNQALTLLPTGANLLAILALSLEAAGYFNVKIAEAAGADIGRLSSAKQFALTAVWTLYGTIALVVGFRKQVQMLRYGALGLLTLAAGKVLVMDAAFYKAPWHALIFNYTFAAFALIVAALAFALWQYKHTNQIDETERNMLVPALLAVANLLAIIGLSLEAIGYFSARIARSEGEGWERLDNARHFTLSLLWSFYAVAALIVGIRRKQFLLRVGALILLALALGKVLLIDSFYYNAAWHALLFNQTFGAFVPLIAALAIGAWFYAQADDSEIKERLSVLTALIIAANVLAIIALSLEASGYYSAAISRVGENADELRNLMLARQLSISVIWAVYGGGMLAVGFWRTNRLLRLMGMGLLGLAIVKVFAWDLRALELIYRVISLIVLGVILLVVSFLYQQSQKKAAQEQRE